jgi:hypothetical protein
MWIVLLDRSDSMRDGFPGTAEPSGPPPSLGAGTKLEAAKAALRERLGELPWQRIALFTFDDTAELIYQGASDHSAALDVALAAIEPGGGTNLGAALDAARSYAGMQDSASPFVLAITDGVEAAARVGAAAKKLASFGAVIDVLLLDPTPEAERLARTIDLPGDVWTAVTPHELRDAVTAWTEREEDRTQASFTFDTVFASHSSKDKHLVRACVAAY